MLLILFDVDELGRASQPYQETIEVNRKQERKEVRNDSSSRSEENRRSLMLITATPKSFSDHREIASLRLL